MRPAHQTSGERMARKGRPQEAADPQRDPIWEPRASSETWAMGGRGSLARSAPRNRQEAQQLNGQGNVAGGPGRLSFGRRSSERESRSSAMHKPGAPHPVWAGGSSCGLHCQLAAANQPRGSMTERGLEGGLDGRRRVAFIGTPFHAWSSSTWSGPAHFKGRAVLLRQRKRRRNSMDSGDLLGSI